MSKESTPKKTFSSNATLAAIGLKLQSLKVLAPIERLVKIKQKTIDHTPIEKLKDAFITVLAGAHGLHEINTTLRTDPALQRAFGRKACAEQSVVQDTLDACTPTNVDQMQTAFDEMVGTHSHTAHHDYAQAFLIADGDLTGLPCGPTAEGGDVGYLSGEGIRTGRQLGRIVATQYGEVITDRVFPGNTVMPNALRVMVESFERTLGLDTDLSKRQRTILRFDAAAGSLQDVNWLLGREYHLHGKDYSSVRAKSMATQVEHWFDDPKRPGRQVGRIRSDALESVRPLTRIAIRWRLKNGQWKYAALHSTLSAEQVLGLVGEQAQKVQEEGAVLLAYARFYDQRGGGVETEIKQDKQGLAMRKRQKKRMAAQQMVQLLTALAHNVVLWSRAWLQAEATRVKGLGVVRWIRDVMTVSGCITLSRKGRVKEIVLNVLDPMGRAVAAALSALLAGEHVRIRLGEI